MSIAVGDTVPQVDMTLVDDDQIRTVTTTDLFGNGRCVLFSVPGAFTPTCSNAHLPGYVQHFDTFTSRGIKIACMAVNDAFVMQAWGRSQHVPAGLLMLADGNAVFARALGLEMNASDFGMGIRAQRFALYIVDGVIRQVHIEAPGELRVSSAGAMLAAID